MSIWHPIWGSARFAGGGPWRGGVWRSQLTPSGEPEGWILLAGTWNDNGIWVDSEVWNDG